MAAFTGVLVLITLRLVTSAGPIDQRGRYVLNVLRQEHSALGEARLSLASAPEGWPDDFLLLQRWLIMRALGDARRESPAVIARELEDGLHGRSFSSVLRRSVERWRETLDRWSSEPVSPSSRLALARSKYFEGTGYVSLGRSYDATALYLWSARLLTSFIEDDPGSPDVPEALFLLGSIYLNFRHALPPRFRPEELLGLCIELYPESVWAERATSLWRTQMGRKAVPTHA